MSRNLGPQLPRTELHRRTMLQVRSWTGLCHSLAVEPPGRESIHRWIDRTELRKLDLKNDLISSFFRVSFPCVFGTDAITILESQRTSGLVHNTININVL
ncbi:hypothetical protein F2P81_016306 [Scophthalmus maximus]|uniref:Uncharacterized protein n=1 Tax=Scophthalmus maximus TaxID=52904 RepID=A0A6A4SKT6_SCOMX|nr:hypothetical protein F2P81_016306 [Scophthalmus maximus]